MVIPESLKRFRREFNLSQKAVAEKIGIAQPSYAAYELSSDKPKSSTPSGATVAKLAHEYRVSTDYLLGLTDDPRPVDEILAALSAAKEKPAPAKNDIDARLAALEAQFAELKAAHG